MTATGIGLIGCGHRGIAGFLDTLVELGHRERVVGLCDGNPARLSYARDRLANAETRVYADHHDLLAQSDIGTVIIATPDHSHAALVIDAFAAGKRVVCEKPLATRLVDCQSIMRHSAGHNLHVAFNFRYNPVCRMVKDLLVAGTIGPVLQVVAEDIVGWEHGSDYFRRWHRLARNSGSLLVHKSVHAFDVINWWLDEPPSAVYASAATLFYTPDLQRGERCTTCSATADCRFAIDLTAPVPGQVAPSEEFYSRLYVDGFKHDGYSRDTCVFHANNDVPDTYNVSIRYPSGCRVSYAAMFYGSYEDRRFSLQGTKGRIEMSRHDNRIRVYRDGDCEIIDVSAESGTHGGADRRLVRALFDSSEADRLPTAEAGYWSAALSAVANDSIAASRELPIPAP